MNNCLQKLDTILINGNWAFSSVIFVSVFTKYCVAFIVDGTITYADRITWGPHLCIQTPNTVQLNPLFHTYAEFRPIVNRVVAPQSTDWLAANAQFSLNVMGLLVWFIVFITLRAVTFILIIRNKNLRWEDYNDPPAVIYGIYYVMRCSVSNLWISLQ